MGMREALFVRGNVDHEMTDQALARQCEDTAQVIAQRKESVGDEEPHELMPRSYQEARARALKVAEDARATALHLDMGRSTSPEKVSPLIRKHMLPDASSHQRITKCPRTSSASSS